MESIPELLATALERPRELSRQIVDHLQDTYELERHQIAGFLRDRLGSLEDYQVDLALAPAFTPGFDDQAEIAGVLGVESIPRSDWPGLVATLVARPTLGSLIVPGGEVCRLPLRPVTVERFLFRLRLDGTVPPGVRPPLEGVASPATRAPLLAVARRPIWESGERAAILARFLLAAQGVAAGGIVEDCTALLKVVEAYEPEGIPQLLARIPGWIQALGDDLQSASGPKPFFNERVQELHGGGRDTRSREDQKRAERERELDFLRRLKRALQAEG